MKHAKKPAAAALAAILLIGLAACGDNGSTSDAQAEQTAPNGDVFNDAFHRGKLVHRAVHLDGRDGRAFE